MGSVLSYLTTASATNVENDGRDGAAVVANMTLLELLDDMEDRLENPDEGDTVVGINWDRMYQRLISHPEEAAAYCHTVETSPLVRCLLLKKEHVATNHSTAAATATTTMIQIPVRVVRAFLNAYEDAAYDSDQYGTTALLAAVQRTAMPTVIVPPPVTTAAAAAVVDHDNDTAMINDHNEINDFRSISAQVEAETTAAAAAASAAAMKLEAREIINMVLQTNTGAVSYPNKTGMVPLHYVRTDIITAQHLVKMHPSAIFIQDKEYQRTPLHNYCCLWHPTTTTTTLSTATAANGDVGIGQEDEVEAAEDEVNADVVGGEQATTTTTNHSSSWNRLPLPDPQIARLLIVEAAKIASTTTRNSSSSSSNPVLIKDELGLTPLDILYQELSTTLTMIQEQQQQQQQQHSSSLSLSSTSSTILMRELKTIRDRLWEILIIFIQSIVCNKKSSTFQMIHALVSLHCPAVIMKEALRRYPQQTIERDNHGRTPLLISVDLLDGSSDNNNSNKTSSPSSDQHHHNDQERAAAVCCELIKCNPTAARMTDEEGRVAIDLLSEKGFYNEELFEAFVKAEPRAIDTRDLKNRHYPFLTAALAPNNKSNVASVYHLLRAKPHVIQFFLHDHK